MKEKMETPNVQSEVSDTAAHGCPFCNLDSSLVYAANGLAVAVLDAYPVSPGHTLIMPKRHFESLFEATEEERSALFDLLAEVRRRLLHSPQPPFGKEGRACVPDGFNIGINDGAVAGQTVFHLHIHLIPRYAGDCPDPRGGVRKLFPDRAPYWKELDRGKERKSKGEG
jgi:diadenosine tetraphosphate (Ap4A) HIT family hydrolase